MCLLVKKESRIHKITPLNQEVRDETYKSYPSAKLAHLKTGGNFPYLSRSDEVNLHIAIHLRNFESAIA